MHLVSLGTDSTYAYLPEHKWEKLVDQASVRKELAVANAIGTVFSILQRYSGSYFGLGSIIYQ